MKNVPAAVDTPAICHKLPSGTGLIIIPDMAIVTTDELGQTFGPNELFSGINLTLDDRERIGLVGSNGSGKSTLLLILAGLQEPAAGSVYRQKDLTIGYLRQEAVLTFAGHDHSIYEEMLTVFSSLRQMEAALRQMEAVMAAGAADDALMDRYGALQQSYEHEGGYQYQIDIKRVLMGLGFPGDSWETPLTHLSGGQKTRLLLGRLLLEKPALLILDEPTNHLDVDAIEWLEATLRGWDGALIIVSHDRYFLDKIVNRVWELENGAMVSYRGSYTSYVMQRQLNWERELELFHSEKSRLEKDLEFARKHIAGGKTDIAKGKMKRLTRDIILMEQAEAGATLSELRSKSWLEIGGRARTMSVNEAARRVAKLAPPAGGPPRLNIRLNAERRSGRIVLRTGELEIGYPGTSLFYTDKIKLERLDCAALIGPNGSGKSTFLRTLMGELDPLDGWLKFGDSLMRGYFAQGHDQLTMSNRVIDELLQNSELQEAAARTFLAPYLFKGDEVFKQVGDLSGGERGRLALAVLSLSGANFLLLDEPTNHLDIPSQEALQAVLEAFDGTILLVSHDRYLIDRLATQIWELDENHLRIFKGSYQEYLGDKAEKRAAREEAGQPAMAQAADLSWVEELAPPPVSPRAAREREMRLAELTVELDDTEAWLERIGYEMEDAVAAGDQSLIDQLRDESIVLQSRLSALTAEWNDLEG